ncbi:hypothetical protein CVT24_010588 [Panaeolus cyanescens]|uniref:Uncharacterized protein n=1 Tax=Panaeolus cyanescens TaxID=181874 RepID=A0A409WEG0_9AGAR|nr:hypothetical protein CVT24_010588 [Panaeolus cyanescens]
MSVSFSDFLEEQEVVLELLLNTTPDSNDSNHSSSTPSDTPFREDVESGEGNSPIIITSSSPPTPPLNPWTLARLAASRRRAAAQAAANASAAQSAANATVAQDPAQARTPSPQPAWPWGAVPLEETSWGRGPWAGEVVPSSDPAEQDVLAMTVDEDNDDDHDDDDDDSTDTSYIPSDNDRSENKNDEDEDEDEDERKGDHSNGDCVAEGEGDGDDAGGQGGAEEGGHKDVNEGEDYEMEDGKDGRGCEEKDGGEQWADFPIDMVLAHLNADRRRRQSGSTSRPRVQPTTRGLRRVIVCTDDLRRDDRSRLRSNHPRYEDVYFVPLVPDNFVPRPFPF